MTNLPGGHGSRKRNPDLYSAYEKQPFPDDEGSEGRFGRLFAVGETKELVKDKEGNAAVTRLRPHPSPRYDLERFGAKDGHMSMGTDQSSNTPAGITFLGQFVDHDITLDVQSKFERPEINVKLENARTPNLDLDCVYGGGREASPHLYNGAYLLEGQSVGSGESSDQSDLLRNPAGRAIIGDPRNDENILVSQVQAAVIRFHNRCVEVIGGSDEEVTFEKARNTTTHYYHRVLLEDFLFHVVGIEMIQDIANRGRQYYFPKGFWLNGAPQKPYMPVEFSVAAYRFGHSQIRNDYQLNDSKKVPLFHPRNSNLQQSGTLRGFQPLPAGHHVDWSNFFSLPDEDCRQNAFKIDPFLPPSLLELPVPVVGEGGVTSLASRNLLRGRTFRLPAGDELADKMFLDGNLLGGASQIVRIGDANNHSGAVGNILRALGSEYAMTTIPLWLYVLCEAAIHGKADGANVQSSGGGDRLGPVGGRIVAEVIMGLLDHYRDMSGNGLDYSPDVPYSTSDTPQTTTVQIPVTANYGPRMSMRAFTDFAYAAGLQNQARARGAVGAA